ncbi:MAG: hypothetical protein AAFN77_15650 [Planctomycetota bacterium]
MTGSIYSASFKRQVEASRLELTGETTSQWLGVAAMRSAFCIALNSTPASWTIEAQLPDGGVVTVGQYNSGTLFNPTTPRYITVNAMCGLPIRFVSSVSQSDPNLWVICKS